jgi:hypothetical protein
MKFKVGDRVKRISRSCTNLAIGDIGRIIKVNNGSDSYRVINERNGREQTWGEDFIESLDNQTINIYRNNLEVIAILKSGKGTVKTAVAKCNPADEFKFEIGAKLAVQRLFSEELTVKEIKAVDTTPLTADRFKVGKNGVKIGDIIRVLNSEHEGNHYKVGGTYRVVKIEIDKCHRIKEGNDCWDVVTENFEIVSETLKSVAKSESSPFDWSSFKSGKFAVHCDTEEKAREFLKECDAHGIKWCGGDKPSSQTHWDVYKDKTLYDMSFKNLSYCDVGGYAQECHKLPVIDYAPSKPTVKEVSRIAKAGEYVKIVNSKYTPTSKIKYENGDVLKIIRVDDLGARYGEGSCEWLYPSEYVVLENYHPEEPKPLPSMEEPKPFVKAKVGDKIKVIKERKGGHFEDVKSDDATTISEVDHEGVWSKNRNYYYDSDAEYIILDSTEDKPVSKPISEYTKEELIKELFNRVSN